MNFLKTLTGKLIELDCKLRTEVACPGLEYAVLLIIIIIFGLILILI